MKILSEKTFLPEMDNQIIQKCDEGRWYHLDRVFIIKTIEVIKDTSGTKTQYKAVSLNLAERIVAFVSQLFNPNYFSSQLKVFQATLLNSKEIQSTIEVEKPIMAKHKADFEAIKETVISILVDLMAVDVIFTGLNHPARIDMKELKEAAAFVEKHINEQANGHAIEFNKDTFSAHPHLNHFDTLIASLRYLVTSSKIIGYEVFQEASTVKIALNEQSEIVQNPSFISKDVLFNTTIKPAAKKLMKEGLLS